MASEGRRLSPPLVCFGLTQSDLDAKADTVSALVRIHRTTTDAAHRLLTGAPFPALDRPKLWDAANIVELLAPLGAHQRVLDAGAFNSPAPWALAHLGFRHVHAIDLNPRVLVSPWRRRVNYSCQDMQQTAFAPASFDAVVSGSTIEHGVDWKQWLSECHRILKPGGLLYVSTDLVHEAVDTHLLEAFGLPWTPLRPRDVAEKADLVAACGFETVPVPKFELPDRLPLSFLGHSLGFVAFVTRKCQ